MTSALAAAAGKQRVPCPNAEVKRNRGDLFTIAFLHTPKGAPPRTRLPSATLFLLLPLHFFYCIILLQRGAHTHTSPAHPAPRFSHRPNSLLLPGPNGVQEARRQGGGEEAKV